MDQEILAYILSGVLVIRNNDMWFEGKWMQLYDIMLSEVSQDCKHWNFDGDCVEHVDCFW
jgi:hypothetical protein